MVTTAMAPVASGVRGVASCLSSRAGGIVPLPPRSATACLAPHINPVAAKRSVFAQAEHQQVSASNEVMICLLNSFTSMRCCSLHKRGICLPRLLERA
jgi:hypothetical protein